MKKKALKAAFPYTIPIGIGFLFLGISYGFMMQSKSIRSVQDDDLLLLPIDSET